MKTFSKFIAIIFCFVSFTFMQTLILSWLFFDLGYFLIFPHLTYSTYPLNILFQIIA